VSFDAVLDIHGGAVCWHEILSALDDSSLPYVRDAFARAALQVVRALHTSCKDIRYDLSGHCIQVCRTVLSAQLVVRKYSKKAGYDLESKKNCSLRV